MNLNNITRTLIILIQISLICFPNTEAQENDRVESKYFTILECIWGNEDVNIGKIDPGGEAIPQGPRDFIIDRDNIFIGDGVNSKVKLFKKYGGLISVTPINGTYNNLYKTSYNIESFKLDNQGNLIILKRLHPLFNKLKILKFNKNGVIIKEHVLKDRVNTGDEFELEFGPRNYIYLYSNSVIYKLNKDLITLGKLERKIGEPSYFISKNNMIRYSTKRNLNKKIMKKDEYVSSLNENVQTINFDLNLNEEKYFSKRLSYVDKEGNYYFRIWKGLGNHFSNIIKTDQNGEYIGKIDIKPSSYHYANNYIFIDDEGDVYIMKSNKEKFWIDCYPSTSFSR